MELVFNCPEGMEREAIIVLRQLARMNSAGIEDAEKAVILLEAAVKDDRLLTTVMFQAFARESAAILASAGEAEAAWRALKGRDPPAGAMEVLAAVSEMLREAAAEVIRARGMEWAAANRDYLAEPIPPFLLNDLAGMITAALYEKVAGDLEETLGEED